MSATLSATLTPAERARLLGKPEGEAGIAMADNMNRSNGALIETVFRRVADAPGLTLLEIGFGNAKTLPTLMAMAEGLAYTGLDYSPTMVAEAAIHNAALVAEGLASFHLGDASAMSFADASFDRVFAVNVITFWPDPVACLREIRRVLRPEGFALIAAVDPSIAATADFARPEFGFTARDAATLEALHRDAGFTDITSEPYTEVTTHLDGGRWERLYHLVTAHP